MVESEVEVVEFVALPLDILGDTCFNAVTVGGVTQVVRW